VEYDDGLDISMYSHEEIDNEHDHLRGSLGPDAGFYYLSGTIVASSQRLFVSGGCFWQTFFD
jgi:hypothetical protein